jgi:hypothetical protein
MQKFEKMIEAINLLFVLGNIIFLVYAWNILPNRIPLHYTFSGQIDKYGGKYTLIFLPIVIVVMYLGLTLLCKFPHVFNYAVEITSENAERQYRIGVRYIMILKLAIVIIFSYIQFKSIQLAFNNKDSLGVWFLPIFLLVLFVPLIIYVKKSISMK